MNPSEYPYQRLDIAPERTPLETLTKAQCPDLLAAADNAQRDCDEAASALADGNPEGLADALAATAEALRAAIQKATGGAA